MKCLQPFMFAALLPASSPLAAKELPTPSASYRVENTPSSTIVTASAKDTDSKLTFRIDWLHGNEKPASFSTETTDHHSATATYRLGKTTLTRTVLASKENDCLFLHVHADQPGPVGFTAKFTSEGTTAIRNRREIAFSGKEIRARAWILPFESDVEDDGKATLTLTGEGEALVILNLTADPEARPIAGTLLRLAKKHDPGQPHPNPHLIWEGVRKRPPEALPATEPRF